MAPDGHRQKAQAMARSRRARALDELTQGALTHLARPDLLQELLERMRIVMDADNAAILLLDEDEQHLVLHAVRGAEEVVAGAVRIPVGRGVAGSIVASRQPLLVDDLSTVEVVNPFLRTHLRSLIGAPLIVHGRVIGAIHVDSTQLRHFSVDDRVLLEEVAQRIAMAVDYGRLLDLAERRRREAAARAQQLQAVFSALTEGVIVYDTEGHIVHLNAAARTLLGLPDDDTLAADTSHPYSERIVLADVRDADGRHIPPEEQVLARVLRGEVLSGTRMQDVHARLPDGREVWISAGGAPLCDADGRVSGAVVILHDVTERRRLERRTAEALNALLAMAESLVAAPAYESPESESVEDTRSTPAGMQAQADLSAKRLKRLARRLAELTRQVLGCERVSLTTIDATTGRGEPLAMVGLSAEQERVWWETQPTLHATEYLDTDRAVRLAAGDAVVLELAEQQSADLPSYDAEKTLVVPMLLRGQLVGSLTAGYGATPHTYTASEIALAGAVARLTALVVERERLLREREGAQAHALALAAANERMNEFLGVVSHELRTPVTVIRTNIQVLLRRARRAQQAERASQTASVWSAATQPDTDERVRQEADLLQRANVQVDRLIRLLNDLTDMARIHAGRLELRLERCDLTQIVRDAVADMCLADPERTILLEAPADRAIPVVADADRIAQVLTNYLTNALKYSDADAPVAVRVSWEDTAARVEVRDQGPGIPEEEREHVWTLYHRVPSIEVRTGSGIGLGLGLHISREIIERHGGQVGVESAPGAGSIFSFTLPLAASAG